mgnify:CR=1 FL=1
MKEYATSQVASLLPHFGYRFTHALKTIPVHLRQTLQREALQIDLCCLNRLMPQQLTDNLDRYILFLQERGEWMTDRIRGDRKRNACRSRQQLQVTVKAGQGPVIFFVAASPVLLPLKKEINKGIPLPYKRTTHPTAATPRRESPAVWETRSVGDTAISHPGYSPISNALDPQTLSRWTRTSTERSTVHAARTDPPMGR